MDSFVKDVRAALPALVEDTRLTPLTPPKTPPRFSPATDSYLAEASTSNGNLFHTTPQPGNNNVHRNECDPNSNKETISTTPSPPPPPPPETSQAEANIPLLIAQAHSLTLQTSALRDSLALLNASYDLVYEENAILRRRLESHIETRRQKDVAIRRLCQSRDCLQADMSLRCWRLFARIHELDGVVKKLGGECEGVEVVSGRERRGLGEGGEEEEEEEEGTTSDTSADRELELDIVTEANMDKSMEETNAKVAMPVLTSILLDVLAVGLVEGIIYLWQWQQGGGL